MMNAQTHEPPSRGHKKRERTRALLIEAAMRVAASKGEALTIGDVAAEADVSNGTFYNYFRDKDELLEALASHLTLTMGGYLDGLLPTEDAALRVASATARVLLRARDDHTWARVVSRLATARATVQEQAAVYLRSDLELARSQGRLAAGASDAAVDLVGGLLLAGLRRIVDGRAEADYELGVIKLILAALGAPVDEIPSLAQAAIQAAGSEAGSPE